TGAGSTQPAVPSTTEYTTSTVYTTNVRTVTSCAPGVPDCPATPHVTTETIAISTTICPVTEQQTKPATEEQPTKPATKPVTGGQSGAGSTQPAVPSTTEYTTSTVYTTNVRTVTSCAPDVPDCPATPH
ncbi:hypothetical protein ACHAQC_011996, partial [Fusarium culmorum]